MGILKNLAGSKIRLGQLKKRHRTTDEEVILARGETTTGEACPTNYPYLCEELSKGENISMADGREPLGAGSAGNPYSHQSRQWRHDCSHVLCPI